jgi:hypothetical protein
MECLLNAERLVMTEKPYQDEEWLRQKYEEEFKSIRQIADECGVTKNTILYWMMKHGIERRDKHWWHRKQREGRKSGSYKGYIPETGHRYPISKKHDCDDPLCPARRE